MCNEIILGIYLAFHPRVDRDGWWDQRGFSNHEDRYSIAASIAYRFRDTSVIVADLGRSSQFIAFTRDDANYNANTENNCNGDCLPTTWGYNYQHAQLIAAAKDYGHFRIGAGIKRTTWTHVRHESEDGDQSKRFTWKFTQTEYNIAPLIGMVASVGDMRIVGQVVSDAYRLRQSYYICCPRSREVWMIGIEK